MKRAKVPNKNRHQHTKEEERTIREAALDETIDASFPASDPPSSDPTRMTTTPSIADYRQATTRSHRQGAGACRRDTDYAEG